MAEKQVPQSQLSDETKKKINEAVGTLNEFLRVPRAGEQSYNPQKAAQFLRLMGELSNMGAAESPEFQRTFVESIRANPITGVHMKLATRDAERSIPEIINLLLSITRELSSAQPKAESLQNYPQTLVDYMAARMASDSLSQLIKTGDKKYASQFEAIWDVKKDGEGFVAAFSINASADATVAVLGKAYAKHKGTDEVDIFDLMQVVLECYKKLQEEMKKPKPNFKAFEDVYGSEVVKILRGRIMPKVVPGKVAADVMEIVKTIEPTLVSLRNKLLIAEAEASKSGQTAQALSKYFSTKKTEIDTLSSYNLKAMQKEELLDLQMRIRELNTSLITVDDLNNARKISGNLLYLVQTGRPEFSRTLTDSISWFKGEPSDAKKQVYLKIMDADLREKDPGFYQFLERVSAAKKKPMMETVEYVASNLPNIYLKIRNSISASRFKNANEYLVALAEYKRVFGNDYYPLQKAIDFDSLNKALGIKDPDRLGVYLSSKSVATTAAKIINDAVSTYDSYKIAQGQWGGTNESNPLVQQERDLLQQFGLGMSMPDAELYSRALNLLSARGNATGVSVVALNDAIISILNRDAYLVSSFLANVVPTFADLCSTEQDFQRAMSAFTAHFERMYPQGDQPLSHMRAYMIERFNLISEKLPMAKAQYGHQEIMSEIWDRHGNFDSHPYYRVRAPFLFRRGQMNIPMYPEGDLSLNLMPPGYIRFARDPGRLSFNIDFEPGANQVYRYLYNQLYPELARAFRPGGIPAQFRIARVSAERLLRELNSIFAIVPDVPYSGNIIAGQAQAGAYAGRDKAQAAGQQTPSRWELGATGKQITPTGVASERVTGGKFGDTGQATGVITGGGIPGLSNALSSPLSLTPFGGKLHNFSLQGNWTQDQLMQGALSDYQRTAKNSKTDMLVYLFGRQYTTSAAAVAQYEKELVDLSTRLNELEMLPGANDPATDIGMRAANLRQQITDKQEQIDNAKNTDQKQLKGRLYLIDKNGNTTQLAYGRDTENYLLNYTFAEIDRSKIYASLKAIGPDNNLNGGGFGVTIDKFSAAAIGEYVEKFNQPRPGKLDLWKNPDRPTADRLAYVEEAFGVAGSDFPNLIKQGEVLAAFYRGSQVPILKAGQVPGQGDMQTVQQNVEVMLRRIPPGKDNKNDTAAYEIRLLAGTPNTLGAKLMTEDWIATGGLGATAGYGEFDLSRYFNLLDQQATDLYLKTKNGLISAYRWKEKDAGKEGWLIAGSYMYSGLVNLHRQFDAMGALQTEEEKTISKNYCSLLFMKWARDRGLLAGVAALPGYQDLFSIIDSSFLQMQRDPSMQGEIMRRAAAQMKSAMEGNAYRAAIGFGIDGKIYLRSSAEVFTSRSLESGQTGSVSGAGNLYGVAFLSENAAAVALGKLYSFRQGIYGDTFGGMLLSHKPLGEVTNASLSVPAEMRGVQVFSPEELEKLFTENKAEVVGAVVNRSSTAARKSDAEGYEIIISPRMQASKSRHNSCNAIYAGTAIQLGDDEDAKEWESQGAEVTKISLSEVSAGRTEARFVSPGTVGIVPRLRLMGGPTLKVTEVDLGLPQDVRDRQSGKIVRGYSGQVLAELFKKNGTSIIAGAVYGKKDLTREELAQWQLIVSGTIELEKTMFETKSFNGYILVDKRSQKVYIFGPTDTTSREYRELVAQAGVDYGTLDATTGEQSRFKAFIAMGQFNLGGSAASSPNFLSGINYGALGIGYEKIKRTSSYKLSLTGGANYPYSQFDLWRPYTINTPAETGSAIVPLGSWMQMVFTGTW